jgi:hypothetical protein
VIPDWLLEWPGHLVGVLLGYLSHDIVKPQGCQEQPNKFDKTTGPSAESPDAGRED